MVNKKIRTNIIGMAISCVFIFNPNISVIDLLPDFIGYILLTCCIARIADLNETLEEARVAFVRMIWIDAAKSVALFWTFGMSVTSEYTSSLMLWSFVFCFLEIIFAIPAFTKLFTGLLQIANYYPSEVIFFRKKGIFDKKTKKKNVTENIRTFTVVFLATKAILSFLPELADIANTAYDESSVVMVNLYQFIGLLRFLAFVPVLVLGIIWLVRTGYYFFKLSRDYNFIDAVSQTYKDKILIKKGIFIKRNVQLALLLLIGAAVLTIDFRLENINFIPDFVSAALFLIFFIVIKKYSDMKRYQGIGIGIFYIAAAVVSYISETYFFAKHSYNAIIRSDEALIAFIIMLIFEAIKGLAFIFVIYSVYRSLCHVIYDHTGYVLGRENITEATERQANAIREELKKPMKFMFIAAIVYVVSDIAYLALIDRLGFLGVVNVLCGVFFIGTVIKTQNELLLAVNTKYMLE